MMLFDTTLSDNIVIVPPKPDAFLSHHDEFSYSNLYGQDYNDAQNQNGSAVVDCGASLASTAGTAASSDGTISSGGQDVVAAKCGGGESFDSSVFDNAAAAAASRNNSLRNSVKETTIAASANNINNDNDDASSSPITRDPRNGAFTFQVHAEYDLLLHVQKDLDKHRRAVAERKDGNNASLSDVELSNIIMRSFDEYCLRKQWMYHIGSQKGVAIGRFLRDGVENHLRTDNNISNGEVKKFICVDLGTYCGYSALVLASTLRQFLEDHPEQEKFEFHIYTTEVSTKLLNVAQSVFRLAKMEKYITPVLVKPDGEESLSRVLRERFGVAGIDFLLLDHAKHLYLDDLRDLEDASMLGAGSYVSADNVVFNRLDAYREHIHQLELGGVVESRLEEMNLEYSNNLKDGIEMTVYLKDPPRH
mmetsp:Transcript_33101/g.80081  ORF Transcript_33101/g.80081 Transcript_33101/m.80081 type:complete len:419 (-) Transcript_33101:166-1422(-)